jgi:hypothetical protein
METKDYTTSFTVDQTLKKSSMPSTMSGDGGQEKSRATLTTAAPSSHTVSKTCTIRNKR